MSENSKNLSGKALAAGRTQQKPAANWLLREDDVPWSACHVVPVCHVVRASIDTEVRVFPAAAAEAEAFGPT